MKQPRAALIVLALCLVCPAPGSAAGNKQEAVRDPSAIARRATAEAAENQQELVRAPREGANPKDLSREAGQAEEGNLHKDQHALNPPARYPGFSIADTPAAISCNIPGNPPRSILVPAGKNPMDFCPATAIAIHPLISNDPTPPANWDSLDREQDNIARDELRALELRNKTPGQQTSGQSP